MYARFFSARCWSCLVTLPASVTERMFACQGTPYSRRVPLDPETVRANLLDYGGRTFWALLVAIAALFVARGVRAATMRPPARHRAEADRTILPRNLAQGDGNVLGLLGLLAVLPQR